MIAFSVEPLFPDAIEEMKPLFEAHRDEVGHRLPGSDKPCWELNPDYDRYKTMHDAGMLHLCTARDESGRLVGYYLNILIDLPHYRHVKAAVSDIFFILPAYRRGTVGARLFKFMADEVVKAGCKTVKAHCKSYHDIGPMLTRMGFYEIERVYSLVLAED